MDTARLPRLTAVLAAAAAGAIALSGALPGTAAPPPQAAPGGELAKAFASAADQYDVPRDLLVGLGYAETHLDGHDGRPSQAGGYGIMHLVSNPENRTLSEATKLTGLPTEQVAKEPAANIAGAAAVLDSYADQAGLTGAARDDVNRWYRVVARYSHSADLATGRLYADEVYRLLGQGLKVRTGEGAGLTVAPREVRPERGEYATAQPRGAAAVDYPGALWSAASASNYQVASRPARRGFTSSARSRATPSTPRAPATTGGPGCATSADSSPTSTSTTRPRNCPAYRSAGRPSWMTGPEPAGFRAGAFRDDPFHPSVPFRSHAPVRGYGSWWMA